MFRCHLNKIMENHLHRSAVIDFLDIIHHPLFNLPEDGDSPVSETFLNKKQDDG
jgi:hypothetical protein